ncbi:MAG: winged helix-turn-helix domain-containing protein [Streptosporangiaceae bacterium]
MTESSQRAGDPRSVKRITDPKALRALAHPTRLALIGLLRSEGPLTATKAGDLLGESSASASFHLRQLAKYGLAEEAPGGHGRERPWQATAQFTDVPELDDTPEFAAAAGLFRSVVAERYFESMMRWLEARPEEPEEWQLAAQFGDRILYLTPHELADLGEQVDQLLNGYVDRTANPELRPAGARGITYLNLAFPWIKPAPERRGKNREPVTETGKKGGWPPSRSAGRSAG